MTYVRNPGTGRILPCCWDDCERNGHDEYKIIVHNKVKTNPPLHYIFCSERHKMLYANSHYRHGFLAAGCQSLPTPGGLII